MMSGRLETLRLGDLITERLFRCTDFYNEIFKPVDVRYQIAMPFALKERFAG